MLFARGNRAIVPPMLIGLSIRDVVLIDSLELAIGPGLTVLTGETGAGKSILLDALGLAVGARADSGLVRHGAGSAQATALFALPPDHPVFARLDERGLAYERDEDLVLRRVLGADGRSRAFVNDQATSVGVLRELGAVLLEVHGQHETMGLLDAASHRRLLDDFGRLTPELSAVAQAWSAWRAARERLDRLRAAAECSGAEVEELTLRLAELDRLDPREGEEADLAGERALLGAAEKTLADLSAARQAFDAEASLSRLSHAAKSLQRAGERARQAGVAEDSAPFRHILSAAESVERTLVEATEAAAALDAAADAFEFDPERLEKAEERLFALRALARKLSAPVSELPSLRLRFAEQLRSVETLDLELAEAARAVERSRSAYIEAASRLTAARRAAGDRLAAAVETELSPLKLDKARFRVTVEPQADDRAGPSGVDRIAFEVATNPGSPFGSLDQIASGGELARFALALKAALAARDPVQPLMIFDEVDQGVGGAVADAVGVRLRRLAEGAQVLVVTHSPQVAARADAHWRVVKAGEGERMRTRVETLSGPAREDEIARMLAGAVVTDEARAAARALIAG